MVAAEACVLNLNEQKHENISTNYYQQRFCFDAAWVGLP